jgi:phage terminase large subunit
MSSPIHIPVKPLRSYQRGLFTAYNVGKRRFMMVLPRRSGKDFAALSFTAMRALKKRAAFFYCLPTQAHSRKSVWRNIDAQGRSYLDAIPPELIDNMNATEMTITLRNGSLITLVGSDNIDRIVGVEFAGIVLSEGALHQARSVDLIRPILTANPEAWMLINGTPRGKFSWFYRLFEYAKTDPAIWYVAYETADTIFKDAKGEDGSRVLTKEAIEQDIREGMSPEKVRSEYYCDWSSELSGAYYGDLMEAMEADGRITDVPWNVQAPVITAWDLGVRDAMSTIYAQWDGTFLNIIDAMEDRTGKGLESAIHEVKEVRRYNYSLHIAPHDIKARELRDGKSRIEIAREFGIDFTIAPNLPIQDGISYVRGMLPRIRIDRKCKGLIEALSNYSREWNDEREVYSDKPLHDSCSHYADAVRMLCLAYDQADPGRWKPTTATGMDSSVWSTEEDSEPQRNALGGFVSSGKKYSVEPVIIDGVFQGYYR